MGENAKIEAEILDDIREADPKRTSRCAVMYDSFTHDKRFFCLVFEPLGVSLYDFMKKNHYRGFWMQDIQSMARQSLKALKFLHGELKLAHTDLKPENILLESMEPGRRSHFPREAFWQERARKASGREEEYLRPASYQIKLIDFGNATYEDEHHSSIINTRQYRGPEVLLETGWQERSDIWSIGCILAEMYTGELLFGTHEDIEHLAMMEKTLRPLPGHILRETKKEVKDKYLKENGHPGRWCLNWPEGASSAASEKRVRNQRVLVDLFMKQHRPLADCLAYLLTHDKAERPSAAESLRHPFFSGHFDD